MAVYKVIQDIESEDHLLGPLTLKGLVYVGIVGLLGFINFKLLTSGGGPIKWAFILLLLMPMILFGVLASPLGGQQPTEVWLLARIKFMIMARKRVWNQSGITHLVTVTAPKKIEAMLTKNFTQDEVKSRLSALANTLDSRGWVVKNVNVNLTPVANYYEREETDRLVDTADFVQEVPELDIQAKDDILDAKNNVAAQNMQTLMKKADQDRKQALQDKLEAARKAPPPPLVATKAPQATPAQVPAQKQPAAKHVLTPAEYLGAVPVKKDTPLAIHDLKPLMGYEANARPAEGAQQMTDKGRAAKIELAQSGNDLSVASIAKLASRNNEAGEVAAAFH